MTTGEKMSAAGVKVRPIREGYHTITPALRVAGAARIIEFMKQAFDASEIERYMSPDGTVAHAEMRIGDSVVMLGEPGGAFKPMPASLHVYVPDVDETHRRAIQAGGTSLREPADQFYGDRSGGVLDPGGNEWWISTHVEDVSREEIERRMAAMKR